jgi:DNA-directed RNA polymerase specialized sigma24 family protein
MSQAEAPLGDLVARVRTGDAAAAAELVRRYETNIRVAVRTRLTDPALRRQFDSADICQSVLASFFVRVGLGEYDLADPADLIALLVRMAHNKLVSHTRFHVRHRRDVHRVEADAADRLERMATGDDPARIAAGRELLGAVRAEMIDEELAIADLRSEGYTWPEVAERLGGTAEARRKQFGRTLDRVTAKLGLDDESIHDSDSTDQPSE